MSFVFIICEFVAFGLDLGTPAVKKNVVMFN